MATLPLDKKAARALSAVSGIPYQRCLDAVRVLRLLPNQVDTGDLHAIMTDAQGPRLVGIPAEPADIQQLCDLFAQCPPAHVALALEQPEAETRLIAPIAFDRHKFIYDVVFDGRLWPSGRWSFDASELVSAVQLARHSANPRILVHAAPAVRAKPPPDPRQGRPVSDRLFAVEPSRRSAGQGFAWVHFSEHDLPPYGPGSGELTLPEPLLVLFQRLASHEVDRHEALDCEFQAFFPDSSGSAQWYGLDLPRHARLWFDASTRDADQVTRSGLSEASQ